jgi:hypothetical protein
MIQRRRRSRLGCQPLDARASAVRSAHTQELQRDGPAEHEDRARGRRHRHRRRLCAPRSGSARRSGRQAPRPRRRGTRAPHRPSAPARQAHARAPPAATATRRSMPSSPRLACRRKSIALARRQFERALIQLGELLAPGRENSSPAVHAVCSMRRCSHACATAQSRFTVRGEIAHAPPRSRPRSCRRRSGTPRPCSAAARSPPAPSALRAAPAVRPPAPASASGSSVHLISTAALVSVPASPPRFSARRSRA